MHSKLHAVPHFLILHENSQPGREEQAESHESTKHLPGHGLGVGQIKKTVQKYDGVYSLRLAQPGRFVVDLLLPIDAAAPVEQVFVWESAKEALV